MSDARAIAGTYADLKFIKTRSVAQIVCEIPIEQADAFLEMFGAPQPGKEIPVAIARLNAPVAQRIEREVPNLKAADSTSAGSAKPKRRFQDLSLPEQAGIRCEDEQFHRFLVEEYDSFWFGQTPQEKPATYRAAEAVRMMCGIKSRAELSADHGAANAWRRIELRFQDWLTTNQYSESIR